MNQQPWHELPREIADVLRPVLAEVADETIKAVQTIPVYSRPLEGAFGESVRAGVHEAFRHLLAEIEAGGSVPRPDVYNLLGRGEMRAGRTLESLLSAYRIGARVAWRGFAAAGVKAGLKPDTLYLLAESIFAYIDVLSAESAEGYAVEQSAVASETELRRRRLVRMLVREPPLDPGAIERAARDAGWALPRALAVVAIEGGVGGFGTERIGIGGRGALRLPSDTLTERIGELVCAIMPDPHGPGRHAELERAVIGAQLRAGLGTAVPWPEAAVSFARAQAALGLATDGPELVAAERRAGELLLRTDRRLAAELAARTLSPLDALSAGSRTRLRETLAVWLAEQGRLGPTATRLGVHTQTARYRVNRLRELFGPALDDPDERFWIDLALRVDDSRQGSAVTAASPERSP
jgi:hypothetical protein